MLIKASKRDSSIKTRKFKNQGMSIGIIKRKDGSNLPISLKRSDVERYLRNFRGNEELNLDLDGEEIWVKILNIQRDIIRHYPHHIELVEC